MPLPSAIREKILLPSQRANSSADSQANRHEPVDAVECSSNLRAALVVSSRVCSGEYSLLVAFICRSDLLLLVASNSPSVSCSYWLLLLADLLLVVSISFY